MRSYVRQESQTPFNLAFGLMRGTKPHEKNLYERLTYACQPRCFAKLMSNTMNFTIYAAEFSIQKGDYVFVIAAALYVTHNLAEILVDITYVVIDQPIENIGIMNK